MKMHFKHTVAIGFLVLTGAVGGASAASNYVVQAAQGNPFLSSESVPWTDLVDASSSGVQGWQIKDGREVWRGDTTSGTWLTPVVLSETGTTLYAAANGFRSTEGARNKTRICAFTYQGAFSNCSVEVDQPVGSLANSPTVSVYVPTDGSAYAQTRMDKSDGSQTVLLNQIRFWTN